MSEYIVDFGDDAKGAVRIAMAKQHGAVVRDGIVRCRDCKEFAFGDVEYATVDWCDYWGAHVESPDGYCAWGERIVINDGD